MPNEVPIACSLSADAVPDRIEDASRLGRAGLLDVETHGSRASLSFRGDAATRAKIDRFVEAESACCPFFAFDVSEQGETTLLAMAAPEDGTWALRGVVGGIVSGWELPA